jgi:hypothetical protein
LDSFGRENSRIFRPFLPVLGLFWPERFLKPWVLDAYRNYTNQDVLVPSQGRGELKIAGGPAVPK